MKNLSQHFVEHCPHCKKECDYTEYKKEIISQKKIAKIEEDDLYSDLFECSNFGNGNECRGKQKEFLDFYYDFNNSFIDKAYTNVFQVLDPDGNYPFQRAHRLMENSIIIHLQFMKPEIDFIDVKYTFMDKLATFGGNFGIFEMVTGWSLFGILNLILLIFKCLFRFND